MMRITGTYLIVNVICFDDFFIILFLGVGGRILRIPEGFLQFLMNSCDMNTLCLIYWGIYIVNCAIFIGVCKRNHHCMAVVSPLGGRNDPM